MIRKNTYAKERKEDTVRPLCAIVSAESHSESRPFMLSKLACLVAVSIIFITTAAGSAFAQEGNTFSDVSLTSSTTTVPLSLEQYSDTTTAGPLSSVQFTLSYDIKTQASVVSLLQGQQTATNVTTSIPVTLELFWGNDMIGEAQVTGTDSAGSLTVTQQFVAVSSAGTDLSKSLSSDTLTDAALLSELTGSGTDSNFSVKLFVGPGDVVSNGSGAFGLFYGGTASVSGNLAVNYIDSPVPEPSTWVGFAAAACGIGLMTSKRKMQAN